MRIIVYSAKTCAYCIKLKRWLSDHEIVFDDVYIDSDRHAMKQMIKLSGQMSVPFMTVEFSDGKLRQVIGYDEEVLSKLFAAS